MHRLYTTSVASVFPHYVAKVERKGRTREELDAVVTWLTGLSLVFLFPLPLTQQQKVQEVEDPLMRRIRYLDKLVDELAKGRPLEKVLRSS